MKKTKIFLCCGNSATAALKALGRSIVLRHFSQKHIRIGSSRSLRPENMRICNFTDSCSKHITIWNKKSNSRAAVKRATGARRDEGIAALNLKYIMAFWCCTRAFGNISKVKYASKWPMPQRWSNTLIIKRKDCHKIIIVDNFESQCAGAYDVHIIK